MEEYYFRALESMRKASSLPRGDDRQELYINSRRDFEAVANHVESSQIFSENETLDDVATVDLKYILIPAYLAKIFMSSECGPHRLKTFERAEALIKEFLLLASRYDLCDKDVDCIINSDNDSERANISHLDPVISLETAARTRAEKIENFKKMKEMDERIDRLESIINSGDNIEDEVVREYYIKLIKKWVSESVDCLQREVKPAILFERNRPSTSKDGQETSIPDKYKDSTPKTFTIVRNELQKQVFGLGYPSRPTVTVDEFINKKFENKELSFQTQKEIYGNSLQSYAEKPDLLREQEEQSDAEHDDKEDRDDAEELKRKRQWDEFKDDNPRGSGNRHNMG